jgi:malate dehydrogenase
MRPPPQFTSKQEGLSRERLSAVLPFVTPWFIIVLPSFEGVIPMKRKVTVIGAGNVGASLGENIARGGLADVLLCDAAPGIARGKALDMSQACALWGSSARVTGTDDYAETAGSHLVIVTAGIPRKPGMSRDDLLGANADVVRTVTAEAARHSPGAVLIVVTNPMDAMAQLAWSVSGFPRERVLGMGGALDAARLRTFVAWELGVSARDVEALVLGGHGDQMVPLPRFTTVKGVPVTELLPPARVDALIERTRHGGAEVVAHLKTGSAYYAPAAGAYEMAEAVLLDERRMMPCSVLLRGEYGIADVFAGVPAVLAGGGLERVVELELAGEEKTGLHASARAVRELVDKLAAA